MKTVMVFRIISRSNISSYKNYCAIILSAVFEAVCIFINNSSIHIIAGTSVSSITETLLLSISPGLIQTTQGKRLRIKRCSCGATDQIHHFAV